MRTFIFKRLEKKHHILKKKQKLVEQVFAMTRRKKRDKEKCENELNLVVALIRQN